LTSLRVAVTTDQRLKLVGNLGEIVNLSLSKDLLIDLILELF